MDRTDEEDAKQNQSIFSFRHNGQYTGEFKDGNDIVLLKLLKPLQKTKYVDSVQACTPKQEFDKNLPAQIAGYGLTGYKNRKEIHAVYLKVSLSPN